MGKTIQEIYANRHNKLTGREIGRLYLAVSVNDFTRRGMPIMSVDEVLPLVSTATTDKDKHDIRRYFNLELVLRKNYHAFNDIYPGTACTILTALKVNAVSMNLIDALTDEIDTDIKRLYQAGLDAAGMQSKGADLLHTYNRETRTKLRTLANNLGSEFYRNYKDKIENKKPLFLDRDANKDPLPIFNHRNLLDNALRLLRLMIGYNHFVDICAEVFDVPQLSNALIKLQEVYNTLDEYNDAIKEINEMRKGLGADPIPGFYLFEDADIDIPEEELEDFKRKLKKPKTLLKSEWEIENLFLYLPFYWEHTYFAEARRTDHKARWEYRR